MLVAVANTSDTSKNGLYFLFDPNCTTNLKSPDVENAANWTKIGEISEIEDFAARIATIESELSSIKNRLATLESTSDVLTYGYRHDFPIDGDTDKLYVAIDEGKTYVWFNNEYLSVGSSDSSYEEPEVIYGGSAE
jgi:hypothetical protein